MQSQCKNSINGASDPSGSLLDLVAAATRGGSGPGDSVLGLSNRTYFAAPCEQRTYERVFDPSAEILFTGTSIHLNGTRLPKREGVEQVGGGIRAVVRGLSARSSYRMHEAICRMGFECQDSGRRNLMLTLTYPGVWPRDGRKVKRHLEAILKRLERRCGRVPLLWKLEFQRRGAPHYHLLLSVDKGEDLAEWRVWISQAWYEVVGSGDARHLAAGTNLELVHGRVGSYFAHYVGKEKGKRYQNKVPEGFENCGRLWGTRGGLSRAVDPRRLKLTQEQFYRGRRVARRMYRAATGRKAKHGKGCRTSFWNWIPGGVNASLAAQFLRSMGISKRNADWIASGILEAASYESEQQEKASRDDRVYRGVDVPSADRRSTGRFECRVPGTW